MARHIFISHASADRDTALAFVQLFEDQGLDCWIAPRNVRPGTDYSIQLQHAIEECGAFLVLVSDNANKSPFVRVETEMAFSNHRAIFPVRLEDVSAAAGLALFLKIRHWIDAFGPARDANVTRLAEELAQVTGTSMPQPAPAPVAQRADEAGRPAAFTPTPSEEALLAAYVGDKGKDYLSRWHRMEARGAPFSVNLAAGILNIGWLAYRGMWKWAAIAAAAQLTMQSIAFASSRLLPVMSLLQFLVPVAVGLFGDKLYLDHSRRALARSGALQLPLADATRRAELCGGTSSAAGLAALFLFWTTWSAVPAAMLGGSADDDREERATVTAPKTREQAERQVQDAADAIKTAIGRAARDDEGNAAAPEEKATISPAS